MVLAPLSSIFSRKIVNLFAGMAYGSPELPRVLQEGGYTCHAIEQTFGVSLNQQVNPEIVLCSEVEEHTLIVEAKSGANLNSDQLTRYSLISANSLQRRAFTSAAAAQKHDVLIVGRQEFTDRLLKGSKLVPSPRRILSVTKLGEQDSTSTVEGDAQTGASPRCLTRIENDFATSRLNTAFGPDFLINWDMIPNNYLPVDHESTDWEFAEYILPEVIAATLEGKQTIALNELAESFIRHWQFIAPSYKKSLLDRIEEVLRLAGQTRFSSYIKGVSGNLLTLIVQDNLNENKSLIRGQLRRRFLSFMEDLKSPQIAFIYKD